MRVRFVSSYFAPFDDGAGAALEALAAKGYDGVEVPLFLVEDVKSFAKRAAAASMTVVPLILTGGPFRQGDAAAHIADLQKQLERLREIDVPHVKVHGGRDDFSESGAQWFFDAACDLQDRSGRLLAHETHRGRILYTPWRTAALIEPRPSVRLVCDYSHWTTVTETLLADYAGVLQLCASRAVQIDARIGFEEGPQIGDPRAPFWSAHVEWFMTQWRTILDAQRQRGAPEFYINPEFLPHHYMPRDAAGEPVSDYVELQDWVMATMKREAATAL
jgi:hypothetical protein